MARIMILTGPPGAGKTTLAAHLAAGSARGVHVRGDTFYTFLAQPIAPVLPESQAQNETVIRATLRAAAAFAAGGYEVFLDGIFGPWFLPLIAAELAPTGLPVEYVVLRIELERARARATTRATDPATAHVVERMHAAFADLAGWDRHALDVEERATAALAAVLSGLSTAGRFRLDLARLDRQRRSGLTTSIPES